MLHCDTYAAEMGQTTNVDINAIPCWSSLHLYDVCFERSVYISVLYVQNSQCRFHVRPWLIGNRFARFRNAAPSSGRMNIKRCYFTGRMLEFRNLLSLFPANIFRDYSLKPQRYSTTVSDIFSVILVMP